MVHVSVVEAAAEGSVHPVDDFDLGSQLFLDSRLDSGEMRARKINGVALLHAGRKDDCFCTSVNQHFRSECGPLTGAAPHDKKPTMSTGPMSSNAHAPEAAILKSVVPGHMSSV